MGHDHHHVKIPEVPDPSIYKVESSEYLMNIQKRLAEKGLKDPWLRNHVWRTNMHKKRGRFQNWVLLDAMTYKWKWWVPLVGLTIAVESFFGIDYHGHSHGEGEHGGHGEGGHH